MWPRGQGGGGGADVKTASRRGKGSRGTRARPRPSPLRRFPRSNRPSPAGRFLALPSSAPGRPPHLLAAPDLAAGAPGSGKLQAERITATAARRQRQPHGPGFLEDPFLSGSRTATRLLPVRVTARSRGAHAVGAEGREARREGWGCARGGACAPMIGMECSALPRVMTRGQLASESAGGDSGVREVKATWGRTDLGLSFGSHLLDSPFCASVFF
ncbi:uncharacterized protein LOC131506597 isoform X2 [Neofelis nebulosa]|uniref:uncharacterized protein LOC131506597 isoform X2 n=1 Tax=Neofelis nebulosa TaxID=61452 RepID=UPI00272A5C3C|nr:uncharacterized protein LOC131506597 isoform X2 [Neofelis nebulosa]